MSLAALAGLSFTSIPPPPSSGAGPFGWVWVGSAWQPAGHALLEAWTTARSQQSMASVSANSLMLNPFAPQGADITGLVKGIQLSMYPSTTTPAIVGPYNPPRGYIWNNPDTSPILFPDINIQYPLHTGGPMDGPNSAQLLAAISRLAGLPAYNYVPAAYQIFVRQWATNSGAGWALHRSPAWIAQYIAKQAGGKIAQAATSSVYQNFVNEQENYWATTYNNVGGAGAGFLTAMKTVIPVTLAFLGLNYAMTGAIPFFTSAGGSTAAAAPSASSVVESAAKSAGTSALTSGGGTAAAGAAPTAIAPVAASSGASTAATAAAGTAAASAGAGSATTLTTAAATIGTALKTVSAVGAVGATLMAAVTPKTKATAQPAAATTSTTSSVASGLSPMLLLGGLAAAYLLLKK